MFGVNEALWRVEWTWTIFRTVSSQPYYSEFEKRRKNTPESRCRYSSDVAYNDKYSLDSSETQVRCS